MNPQPPSKLHTWSEGDSRDDEKFAFFFFIRDLYILLIPPSCLEYSGFESTCSPGINNLNKTTQHSSHETDSDQFPSV